VLLCTSRAAFSTSVLSVAHWLWRANSLQIAKNTKSAMGNQRLTKMIAQDGKSSNVRVCYAGEKLYGWHVSH